MHIVRVTLFGLIFSFSLFVKADETKQGPMVMHKPIQISRSDELNKQLQQALSEKGDSYNARTEHLDKNGHPYYTNRLILEDSPYLLQHAHNPVDWYAWGEEAFAAAKRANKPIFLSIGYSTCHWCHVMERESFENPEIAEILNEHFIAIKVDRERRPDIDATYMNAVMMIAGSGGWPMSSFLTPDGKTFFAGTYFPPEHFLKLVERIDKLWKTEQQLLTDQATQIANSVAQISKTDKHAKKIGPELVQLATESILDDHDEFQGGFGQAPKFPNESLLFFLLNRLQDDFQLNTYSAVENTLDAMAQGGIYDQIAGGFHRYSTDNEWLVPHFEKMLYNQAHLSRIYLQAWAIGKKPEYERVVRQTLDYILREMTDSNGGFYSATDADSEGEEGLFFLWSIEEIEAALAKNEAELMLDLYQIKEYSNFEGSNILSRSETLEAYAQRKAHNSSELIDRIANNNQVLWQKRQSRVPPLRDDKILTAWNGMMITSFAQAGYLFNESRYSDSAVRAANYIWDSHRSPTGKFWRASLNGKTSVAASQEDYAYLAESFIMLYDTTDEEVWLERAEELTSILLRDFWDGENSGFFMSAVGESLTPMGRAKSGADNAIPSGNSVALHVLQKLYRRTENLDYETHAKELLASTSASIFKYPNGYAYLLSGVADLNNGESGITQYAARGKVKIRSTVTSDHRLSVRITTKPGWHINSNTPLQDYLIATRLTTNESSAGRGIVKNINYPVAINRKLGFQTQTLSLYEGTIDIVADLQLNKVAEGSGRFKSNLILQACSDSVCLAPETVVLSPIYSP